MDNEIQRILNQIKFKAAGGVESTLHDAAKTSNEDDKRINTLLMDIEKEFQDLDDILKEVDEVVASS